MSHLFRRRAPVLLIIVVGLVALAQAASAHVTVSSPDAAPGGFGKLVFRVPTESATARTVKLTVTLPTNSPFAFVSAKPLPGWSVAMAEQALDKPIKAEGFTLTKAVSAVTWTAAKGQGVGPGEFQEFELSVGPFPEGNDPISMPAVQTHSDGTVVRWNQPTPSSGQEPEHPAPTLELAAATPHTDQPATPAPVASTASGGDVTDGLARWLGVAGLALGILALAIAILSTRRRTA